MTAVKFSPGSGQGSPLRDLQAIIDQLEASGGAVEEYVDVVAEEMVARVLQNFETESGHTQGPWAPSDFKHRRRQAAANKLLRDTGIMYGSIQPWAEGNVAEAFTNTPYAVYHTSKEPRSKIPLRDFLDIDLEAVADYAGEIMLAGILEGGGAGAGGAA